MKRSPLSPLSKALFERLKEALPVPVYDHVPAGKKAPYAVLTARTARDRDGPALATVRVEAGFKLSDASALAWIEDGYRRPG